MEKLLKLKRDLIGRFERYELLPVDKQLAHIEEAQEVSKDIGKTQKSINSTRKEMARCMTF